MAVILGWDPLLTLVIQRVAAGAFFAVGFVMLLRGPQRCGICGAKDGTVRLCRRVAGTGRRRMMGVCSHCLAQQEGTAPREQTEP